jgi:hypothetical protein
MTNAIWSSVASQSPILEGLQNRKDMENIMVDLLNGLVRHHDVTCVTIISDTVYLNVFEGLFFRRTYAVPIIMVRFRIILAMV